jgi:hypothetical protein
MKLFCTSCGTPQYQAAAAGGIPRCSCGGSGFTTTTQQAFVDARPVASGGYVPSALDDARSLLRRLVEMHDAWIASLEPELAIDDPLSDAVEAARAYLGPNVAIKPAVPGSA